MKETTSYEPPIRSLNNFVEVQELAGRDCENENSGGATMSFMKGDLLTRTRKLVKGLAMAEPRWLKAMEQLGSSLSQ